MGLEPPTWNFLHQENLPENSDPFHEVKKLFQTMDFSGDGAINLQDGFTVGFHGPLPYGQSTWHSPQKVG